MTEQNLPFLHMFEDCRPVGAAADALQDARVLNAAINAQARSLTLTVRFCVPLSGAARTGIIEALKAAYALSHVELREEIAPAPRQEAPEKPERNTPPAAPTATAGDLSSGDAERDALFRRTEELRRAAIRASGEARPAKTAGRRPLLGKATRKAVTEIAELTGPVKRVALCGRVFAVNHREVKRQGGRVISFDLADRTGSVRCAAFFPEPEGSALANAILPGVFLTVQGEYKHDPYENDMTLCPVSIVPADPPPAREDAAPERRVELHLHTQMSAMDALTDTAAAVRLAARWGHAAIAITDHGVAHSFPDAASAAKKAAREGNPIKVIFGTEAYLVNDVDGSPAVRGGGDAALGGSFVCFDLETTGLYPRSDLITEIGAVRLENGSVTERFHTFADPGQPLSPEIVRLTGITDEMLSGAPDQETALRAFLAFAGDAVLVAHNADFDAAFLSEGCRRAGIPFSPTTVDTLALSRRMLPHLRQHKLNHVAGHLGLRAFKHHRATDDAAAAAGILSRLFDRLREKGCGSVGEINRVLAREWPGEMPRYSNHLIILAKNQTGLRNLYKLITLSHLEHFRRHPCILKSLLNENREGLILGTACEAGELFTALVKQKSWAELRRIAEWYDYLEIQPLCNNAFMLRNGIVADEEALREFNRTVVRLGAELGKPVCATGDVHFLEPEDETFRHILLAGRKFEDCDAPLPLYFRTTDEMLAECAYLGEETARRVVVEWPNLVAGWCEEVSPLPKGLFPPALEGAEEELTELVWSRARALYGDVPPPQVHDRIRAELDDIIRCQYAVIYMSAQKLVAKSLENGYLVGSRGSVGSSFVAFLACITEVNALPPHYRCPACKHSEFDVDARFGCGADLPDRDCPHCGARYEKDGFQIPFETFLGFGGDKIPDIDLNFSGEYQAQAHRDTVELFGKEHVFRAGTIGTLKSKTAYGLVKNYLEERKIAASKAEENRLVGGLVGVKRTTGQHPGGLVVIPADKKIYDFCPAQHPADNSDSDIVTTHFEYHAMEDNLLKLDILGHDDPSMLKMLGDLTGVDVRAIPLDDPDTMSIFKSSKTLGFENDEILGPTGACAIPEFGTGFVRGMLLDTKPDCFDTLVRLSGFSHGTDVWLGNARELIVSGTASVGEAIGCRDDIMLYLISRGMDERRAFKIMEDVRKGKGLPDGAEEEMARLGVPGWYIGSCKKIKYLFPKAHAAAYVMMAFRIAWFKVHRPLAFYAAYFTVRAKAFDAAYMTQGMGVVRRKMDELRKKQDISSVEEDMLITLEVCYEFYLRGFSFCRPALFRSDATRFLIDGDTLIPPFTSVAGLGEAAARDLAEQREGGVVSVEEVASRCSKVSKTHIAQLRELGAFGSLPDTSQLTLF